MLNAVGSGRNYRAAVTSAKRFVRRWSALLAMTLGMVPSRPALGVETEAIGINYAASADCPTRTQFIAEIRARTQHFQLTSEIDVRQFEVTIARSDAGYAGVLRILDSDRSPAEREIDGETCQSVALALAIAAALAVDPQADTTPEAAVIGRPGTGDASSAGSSGSDAGDASTAAKQPRKPPAAAPHRRPVAVAPVPRSARPSENAPASERVVSAGVAMTATWGPAPEVLLTPAPFAALEFPASSPWQLALRVEPLLAQTGTIGPDYQPATFRLMALRAEACPLALQLLDSLVFRPCVAADAGAIQAEGRDVARPRSETRPWLSAGLRGRLTWLLGPVFFVDLAGGAQAAVTRDEYVFRNPRTHLYQPSALDPTAEFSLGGRFF